MRQMRATGQVSVCVGRQTSIARVSPRLISLQELLAISDSGPDLGVLLLIIEPVLVQQLLELVGRGGQRLRQPLPLLHRCND